MVVYLVARASRRDTVLMGNRMKIVPSTDTVRAQLRERFAAQLDGCTVQRANEWLSCMELAYWLGAVAGMEGRRGCAGGRCDSPVGCLEAGRCLYMPSSKGGE